MIENGASGAVVDDGLLRRFRLGLLVVSFGLSACVSDALPRDDDDGSPPVRDASADTRDGDAGDAPRVDVSRPDVQDAGVTDAGDAAPDNGNTIDAAEEGPVIDAAVDLSVGDIADVSDAGVPDVSVDVTTDPGVADVAPDLTTADADARADAEDATAADVNDAGPAPDVSDSGGSVDAGDATDAGDGSSGIDANDADTAADTADARDAAADTADGGVVVFFNEPFNSGLGAFSQDVTVCGVNPPVWSNMSGYAHATEPIGTGASSIRTNAIPVPGNVSNVRLRMSHRFDTEPGFDAAQLFVSINGLAPTQVTTFTTGGYVNGGNTDPYGCTVVATQGQYPGWSGNQTEMVSEVNLSTVFGVGPSDTVTIVLRMTVDPLQGGAGWDINWVTLSGTSP